MAFPMKGASLAALLSCWSTHSLGFTSRRSLPPQGGLSEPCDCLSWKGVYSRGGAKCGQGHEFLHWLQVEKYPVWAARLIQTQETCFDFFHRIEDNYCVNMVRTNEPDEAYSGQWCWVSKDCPVGEEPPVGKEWGRTDVKMKNCTPGQDPMLRDFSPQELKEWAEENELNFAFAAKMAWLTEREVRWQQAESFYMSEESDHKKMALNKPGLSKFQLSAATGRKLRWIKKTNTPHVIDAQSDNSTMAVVKGSEVYVIKPEKEVRDQPNTKNSWNCGANCQF